MGIMAITDKERGVARRNAIKNCKLVESKVICHIDDLDSIRIFACKLYMQRGIRKPKLGRK